MGHSESKFQNTNILHYYPFGGNKLYIYLPRQNEFYCFSIYYCKRKYIFYADNSISLPSGKIFFIGGERLIDPLILDNVLKAVAPSDNVLAIDLNHHKNFRIDIEESEHDKFVTPLPEPRSFHGLVFVDPYIYVIGGVVDNQFTKRCYRYHTEDNKWGEIAEMTKNVCHLTEPGIISLGNEMIYLFDSYAKNQTIHKYSISQDQWITLPFETNGFTVLPAISNLVFQISDNNLILVNGMMKENEGYYYYFDFHKEKFILEQKHPALKTWYHDRQGDKNYSGLPLYCMMNEKKVKIFDSFQLEWREEELFLTKIPNYADGNSAICCGR